MSYRLQVLLPPDLDTRIRKEAQRSRVSKGEWVRRAIEERLDRARTATSGLDPVTRLGALGAPVSDIRQMLSEIEAGRS